VTTSALTAAPSLLALGPHVVSVGFRVTDHAAIIEELAELAPEGFPERAIAKRKAEYLAGRFAAQQALAELGEGGAAGRNEDGSPRWPEPVVGSITHGAGRAWCAVARAQSVRGIGIDVERVMDASTKDELMAKICGRPERELLARGLQQPEPARVSLAFSAKESLYKCLYPSTRKFQDFDAAHVVQVAVAGSTPAVVAGELTLELTRDWSTEFRQGQRLQAVFAIAEAHLETAVLLLV
jgi:enterobactin synthetase component D